MNKSLYTTRLTFKTLQWIFNNKHEERFYKCETPLQIGGLIYKILGIHPGDNKAYDRGFRLIDTNALFEWFKRERGVNSLSINNR